MRGRAEVIRLILEETNTPYRDVRLSGDEWRKLKTSTETKDRFAFGQLPALQIGNQMTLVQSLAILQHISRSTGLYGQSVADAARIDMISQGVEDFRQHYTKLVYTKEFVSGEFEIWKQSNECVFVRKLSKKVMLIQRCPNGLITLNNY